MSALTSQQFSNSLQSIYARFLRWDACRRRLVFSLIGWIAIFVVGLVFPSKPFRDMMVATCFQFSAVPAQEGGQGVQSGSGLRGPQDTATVTPSANPTSTVTTQQAPPSFPHTRKLSLRTFLLLCIPIAFVILLTFTPTNILLLCVLGSLLGAYSSKIRAADRRLPSPISATTAMVHGMCVFLGIAAGVIVIQGEPKWDETGPSMYIRLAAAAAFISIAAGGNKNFLRSIGAAFKPFPGNAGSSAPQPDR